HYGNYSSIFSFPGKQNVQTIFDRLVGSVVFSGVGRLAFCLAARTRLKDAISQLKNIRGRAPACHRRGPSSATGRSRGGNASSSMMCICARTPIWSRWPIQFGHEIDNAARPEHCNHLTLTSESEPGPSVDRT